MQQPSLHSACSVGLTITANIVQPPALSAFSSFPASTQSAPAQARGDRECVLRHVSADPYLTSQAPLSADEHRWATLCHIRRLQPNEALPDWATRVVASIPATTVDQVGPSLSSAGGSSGSSSVPALPAAPLASATGSEVLRHPDPSTSVEELRWRDYQALKQPQDAGGTAPAGLSPPQQTANGTLGSAPALTLQPAPVAGAVPQTPVFPTPVRTLFPPTPVPVVVGVLDGQMDLSDAPDPEGHFKCMYVAPDTSLASPEEMRFVQMESYKVGRQVVPYWMVR